MKKIILKTLLLSSVWACSAGAQQFIDCSEGNEACDVLYATDESFVAATGEVTTPMLKTNDKPLAESRPVKVLPSGNSAAAGAVVTGKGAKNASDGAKNYKVVLPKGATQSSGADNPVPGTVVVPDKKVDSRVDVMPDGSVQTTTIEVTREATPDGYQETTRRIERLDTEKKGAVWVEKSLADKVDYGDGAHDWEAPRGETLRSLLMQWGEVSGWTVVWKLDKDYKLEAGVVFRGTFTEVASAIIRTFARAVPAPIGTFYKGNRVLVVSIQEDENAH